MPSLPCLRLTIYLNYEKININLSARLALRQLQ